MKEAYHRGMALAEKNKDHFATYMCLLAMVAFALARGRFGLARRNSEKLIATGRKYGDVRLVGSGMWMQSFTFLVEDNFEMALEMASDGLGETPEILRPAFAAEGGYPTPKVDVRAVVFRGDEVLLVRERRTGRWTFPGGWADVGDSTFRGSGESFSSDKCVRQL